MTSPTERERSSVVIGKDTTTNEDVRIDAEGRKLSTYIIGMQGMGKSSLLEHVILGDIVNGDGLCFIDPHGQSADYIVQRIPKEREDDVIFWDVADKDSPYGINPFYCTNEDEVDNCGDDFIDALQNLEEFRKAFENSVRISELLRYVATTFAVNQGSTLTGSVRFLEDRVYRSRFYDNLDEHYPQIRRFWERFDAGKQVTGEHIDATLNKLRRFEDNRRMRSIFGKPLTTINFRSAMDEGKIIIVKMTPKIRENNASFIGTFIIWEIAKAVDTRTHPERQFHLVVDEFSRFMTTLFSRLHTQARKQGIDVTIAHQIRDQISVGLLEGSTVAVGNKIIFRVSGKDASGLAQELDSSPQEPPVRRDQAVLAPPFDPLAKLLREGHPDSQIEPLVGKVISILNEWSESFEYYVRDAHSYYSTQNFSAVFYENIRSYLYGRMVGDDSREVLSRELASYFLAPLRAWLFHKTLSRPIMISALSSFAQLEQTIKEALLDGIHLEREIAQLKKFEFTIPSSYPYIDATSKSIPYEPRTDLEKRFQVIYAEIEKQKRLISDTSSRIQKEETAEIPYYLLPSDEPPARAVGKWAVIGDTYVEYDADLENLKADPEAEATTRANRLQMYMAERTAKIGELKQQLTALEEALALQQQESREIEEQHLLVVAKIQYELDIRHRIREQEQKLEDSTAGLGLLQHVYDDVSAIMRLGDALAQTELQTPTGQYETTYDQRPYADVERQVANTLSRQSLYTAQCSLTQGKDVVEYTIKTLPQVEADAEGIARAERIRQKSRWRDSQSGEDEAGLGLPIEPPDKNPPSSPQALEEQATEEEFDDGG